LKKYFSIYGKGGTNPTAGAKVGWKDLIVITMSEFGRTTIQNSSVGTDHAEAGVMFIAGGSINGYGKNSNTSGVFGCGTSDSYNSHSIPWVPGAVTGTSGTMFGASSRYLKRAVDYRSILGKLIRDHLGASSNQLKSIIAGYANSNENLQNGGTGIDGTQIFGEIPIL
jgi:uncharacterized protein (DUF1501 family)